MQISSFLLRIVLLSVACQSVPYFSTLSQKWHDSRKKFIEQKKCFIFYTTCVWNISQLGGNERDIVIMYTGLHVKHSLFLSDFNVIWIFSTDFRKFFLHQVSRKPDQWNTSCSVRVNRWTDMIRLTVTFRNFVEELKNCMCRNPDNAQESVA